MLALLLLNVLFIRRICAQLMMTVHNNTALGLPIERIADVAELSGAIAVTPYQSAQLLGAVTLPAGLVYPHGTNISCESDGGVRLWVDDHLVLDDMPASTSSATRRIVSWVALPSSAPGTSMVPFRLEYTRFGGPETGFLKLLWASDAGEEATVVAADAFHPSLSPAQRQREALRLRLYEPNVPWQTYADSSMTAHTLSPTGLIVRFGLYDSVTGELLKDVNPFQRFMPAHVLPGRHSINGSDYTQVTVRSWVDAKTGRRRDASMSLETTAATAEGEACNGTEGSGGSVCNLLFSATCEGLDCTRLSITIHAEFGWNRIGNVQSALSEDHVEHLQAQGFGFSATHIYPVSAGSYVTSDGEPAFILPFGNVGSVAASTGSRWSQVRLLSAVQAAKQLCEIDVPKQVEAVGLGSLFHPMRDVLAWNTIYTHTLHVYTPVARLWGGGSDDSSSTFVWDNFFAAIMLSTDSMNPRARDIAFANIITTMLSRTVTGMVPNYLIGKLCTYDRTEPMLGSWTVQILHDVFREKWVLDLLLPSLQGWNSWVWRRRRAEGSLADDSGFSDLISLGSDGTDPAGLNNPHTLEASRYESGIDNSPMYDGDDHPPAAEGQGAGPVRYNSSTAHMMLYDIAFSVYHAQDCKVLASLLRISEGDEQIIKELEQRADLVSRAINRDLFDPQTQQYCNRLYNGTFYCRVSPTSIAPMLMQIAPSEQIAGMLDLLASPDAFCVNDSHSGSGPAGSQMLWRMSGIGAILKKGVSVTCTSDRCLQSTVLSVADFEGIEAVVASLRSDVDNVPLELWRLPNGEQALVTPDAVAAVGGVERLGVEGWCNAVALPSRQELSLWHNTALDDYRTCGGSCQNVTKMRQAGYDFVKVLCNAYPASSAQDLPCKYAVPSIARSDAAFWDQLYWRGRQWAPQTFLVWCGLAQYDSSLPAVRLTRQTLVRKARAQFEQQLQLFGQINENMNGVLGVGSDSDRADGYYHWGALSAFVSILEAGAYESKTLLGSVPQLTTATFSI